VTDVVAANEFNEESLLYLDGSVERGSEHPLGKAIVQKAEEKGIKLGEVSEFHSARRKGIAGKVEDRRVMVGSKRLMADHGLDVRPLSEEIKRLEGEAIIAVPPNR